MSTNRPPNPFNPTYTWLHPAIQQLIQAKLEAGETAKQHTWQPEAITCVLFEPFPHPERWLSVEINGEFKSVRLDRLTLSRLVALDEFMTEREQLWGTREPLSAAKNRPSLVNTPVIHCNPPYSRSFSGILLRHSSGGYEHLGDCWLMRFRRGDGWGATWWIDAATLYPLSIPVMDFASEGSQQPTSKAPGDLS